MSSNLCPNGTYQYNGVTMWLKCNKDNLSCAFTRYCSSDLCLKMTCNFKNCKNNNKEA